MIHKKYAIIGSGPAAFYAAAAIRKRDPAGQIVMIGAEGYLPYFRPLISYYLAGLVPLARLFLKETDYYRQKNIEFVSGTVTQVNGPEGTLAYQPLAEGEREIAAGEIAAQTACEIAGKTNEEIERDTNEKPGVNRNGYGLDAAGTLDITGDIPGAPGILGATDATGGPADARGNRFLQFEKLLIASGGAPARPDIPGISTPGVYSLRTVNDAAAIADRAKGAKKALLMGGGLVSLKAACALHKLGLETTLVVASSRILSQMLDKKGAALVASHLAEKDLKMILQKDVAAIHGNSAGVTAVTLTDGQVVEADLVVVGKGVRPFTPFLNSSGINVAGGVAVDDRMQTNVPGIYAAGDVAICQDLLLEAPANNALWPNATAQGEIAGANMCGEQRLYRGSLRMNATEFFGLPVIAAGLGRVQSSEEQPWEICEIQRPLHSGQEPHYLRLVFQGEYLAGYVAVGETRKAGMLTNLITGRLPLAPQQKERLQNGDLVFPFVV